LEKFAFILHPLTARDFARKFSFARNWPDSWIETVMRCLPSFKVSKINGIVSPHASAEGWFIGCPLTSSQMVNLPEEYVLKRIIQAGRVAQRLGVGIVGLGAFTSVVGDAGITIDRELDIAVTTGNSYTVATAIEGTEHACSLMGIDLGQAEVLVLGATGSIGAACAQIMAPKAGRLVLAARNTARLETLATKLIAEIGVNPRLATDVKRAIRTADVVIAVTSAVEELIEPEDLKPGAVVCDVARPRNVSKRVSEIRKDVLVIEGGVVEVPGDVDFGINFGFPPKTAYACMAETMILALEGRYESFTIGREIRVEQIELIQTLAKKHGFKLAGLRSFERALSTVEIDQIRQAADSSRKQLDAPVRERIAVLV